MRETMEKKGKPEPLTVVHNRKKRLAAAIVRLIFAAAIAALPTLVDRADMDDGLFIGICVAAAFFAAVALGSSGIRFVKLSRSVLFRADEKGVYDYDTTLPLGFIPWEEIAGIELHKFDLLETPPAAHVEILLRPGAARNRDPVRRLRLKLSFNTLRPTFSAAQNKREDIYRALKEWYDYHDGR